MPNPAEVEDLLDRPLEVLVAVLRNPDEGGQAEPAVLVPILVHLRQHPLHPLAGERRVLHVDEPPLPVGDRGAAALQGLDHLVQPPAVLRAGRRRRDSGGRHGRREHEPLDPVAPRRHRPPRLSLSHQESPLPRPDPPANADGSDGTDVQGPPRKPRRIRPALHPGWTALLRGAPGPRTTGSAVAHVHGHPRRARPPRRSGCDTEPHHGLLVRRRVDVTSVDCMRPAEPPATRVAGARLATAGRPGSPYRPVAARTRRAAPVEPP